MTDARAERFAVRVAELGLTIHPREMDGSTHTAEQAAAALGCVVEAVVKAVTGSSIGLAEVAGATIARVS